MVLFDLGLTVDVRLMGVVLVGRDRYGIDQRCINLSIKGLLSVWPWLSLDREIRVAGLSDSRRLHSMV